MASTARAAEIASAKPAEPNTTADAVSAAGQPSVYWEKNVPSRAPASQGWKNAGAPPSVVTRCPARNARACQR